MSTPPYIPSPHPYGGEGYGKRVLIPIGPYAKIVQEVSARIAEKASKKLILHHCPDCNDLDYVKRHLSTASMFCRSVVSMGYLTQQQMEHAAERYMLGMSRDGGVIFWQIGSSGKLYDGKIMYYRNDCHRDHYHKPTWVMSELKKFYLEDRPELAAGLSATHCLFGAHLIYNPTPGPSPRRGGESKELELTYSGGEMPVAVVEAEKTAFIMSEIYPQYLWLAAGGLNELTASKLFALQGRKIILFPDTDEDHQAYTTWYKVCKEAKFLLGHNIYLSPLLEQQATKDQKRRKIDIADFYFEKYLEII